MLARHRRQIRRRIGNRLHPRFLIDRNREHEPTFGRAHPLRRFHAQLPIHQQHLAHFRLKIRVPPFEVIANLVRLELLLVQNPLHRSFASMDQSGMATRFRHLANVLGQCPPGPQLRRIPQLLRLGTGQMHDPRLVFRQNGVFLLAVRQIVQGGFRTHRQGPINALIDQAACGMRQGGNLREGVPFMVMAKHPCPLNLSLGRHTRMGQQSKFLHLFRGQHQFGTLRRFRHGPHPTAGLGQMSEV